MMQHLFSAWAFVGFFIIIAIIFIRYILLYQPRYVAPHNSLSVMRMLFGLLLIQMGLCIVETIGLLPPLYYISGVPRGGLLGLWLVQTINRGMQIIGDWVPIFIVYQSHSSAFLSFVAIFSMSIGILLLLGTRWVAPVIDCVNRQMKKIVSLTTNNDSLGTVYADLSTTVPVARVDIQAVNNISNTAATKVKTYSLFLPESDAQPEKFYEQMRVAATKQARQIEDKLSRYGISGKVIYYDIGPVITRFHFEPHASVTINKLVARHTDLALALKSVQVRVVAPIPGTNLVGFEVARSQRTHICFVSLLKKVAQAEGESIYHKAVLPFIPGVAVDGSPRVIDLAQQPHLLIAGATGSGKSVLVHTLIAGLLYRYAPGELQLIIIDPKQLEALRYKNIGHLALPIITESQHAISALNWALEKMHARYQLLAQRGLRNAADSHAAFKDMPPIVIIIDELADLMMASGKEIEHLLVQLAQMARAASIHLIAATQRPSVDVVTGLLKANIPARIALKVTSRVDSRTIIDSMGAEQLLGKGDMLYSDPQTSQLERLHGAYIDEKSLQQLIDQVASFAPPCYEALPDKDSFCSIDIADQALYAQVAEFVHTQQEVSASLLQRRFRIGYNRAARMMEYLEQQGIVDAARTARGQRVHK